MGNDKRGKSRWNVAEAAFWRLFLLSFGMVRIKGIGMPQYKYTKLSTYAKLVSNIKTSTLFTDLYG